MKRNTLLLLILWTSTLAFPSCVSKRSVYKTALGHWDYIISGTPIGQIEGVMILIKKGDRYQGKLKSTQGELQLEQISVEGDKISCTLNYEGYELAINGTFNGDEFQGEVSMGYDGFPMRATRVPQPE